MNGANWNRASELVFEDICYPQGIHADEFCHEDFGLTRWHRWTPADMTYTCLPCSEVVWKDRQIAGGLKQKSTPQLWGNMIRMRDYEWNQCRSSIAIALDTAAGKVSLKEGSASIIVSSRRTTSICRQPSYALVQPCLM